MAPDVSSAELLDEDSGNTCFGLSDLSHLSTGQPWAQGSDFVGSRTNLFDDHGGFHDH